MSLNLGQKVVDLLKSRPEEKFTVFQIAELIFKLYPKECREKKQRSKQIISDEELIKQIYAEIYTYKPKLQKQSIKITEETPQRYYYSVKTDTKEKAIVKDQNMQSGRDGIYHKLSEFLWREFSIYSKHIDEKHSLNEISARSNKWLYPGIVGIEDLSSGWNNEIKGCVECVEKKRRLWSFDVKTQLNIANCRESFFRAVSNSSWANHGYLVTTEIEGTETLKDLHMLSDFYGIGLIICSTDNSAKGKILIPSRFRGNVDWDIANKLAEENTDFLEYIKLVSQFYKPGNQRARDWGINLG